MKKITLVFCAFLLTFFAGCNQNEGPVIREDLKEENKCMERVLEKLKTDKIIT